MSALIVGAAVLAMSLAACESTDDLHADRQARIIASAMSYPRQADANGLARAALALWRGEPNGLSILEATDLHPSSNVAPAARVVIRIHVPAHTSTGFGDSSVSAHDLCYRLEFLMPSSSEVGDPTRVDCPPGARALDIPPAPPEPHLPGDAQVRLAKILRAMPLHPSLAEITVSLRKAFSTPAVKVSAEVVGDRVAVAAGITHLNDVECVVALRTGLRVEAIHPDPRTLLPGEDGCRADVAIHPVTTH